MTAEQMELVKTFLPLVLACLTILGGLLLYGRQKSLDRTNEILRERRELYRKFVGLAQRLQTHRITGNEDSARKDYEAFKVILAELLVTAPDRVVEPLKDLDKSIAALLTHKFGGGPLPTQFGDQADELTLLSGVSSNFNRAVVEMRKDSFSDSEFTMAFLESVLNISGAAIGARIR